MTVATLTDPQRRALEVLVAAESGQRERRPCRTSNRTTRNTQAREMLTVHHAVADQLVEAGLVRVVNSWIGLLELEPKGRDLARELDL